MERREWGGRLAVGKGWGSRAAAVRQERSRARGWCGSPLAAAGDECAVIAEKRAAPAVERQLGFTATELLIALAVVGVLMSMAVPGFAALTRSVGLSSAANELLTALHTARSSAVLRGLPVAVCLTADDRTCVAAPDAAAAGWLVFLPAGSSSAVSRPPVAVGEVLTRFRLPDRLTVSASRPTVLFWPVTRAGSTSTFDLCDLAGVGKSIVVSQTGRPRVATEATSCA